MSEVGSEVKVSTPETRLQRRTVLGVGGAAALIGAGAATWFGGYRAPSGVSAVAEAVPGLWSLAWRRQAMAVEAIEDRDAMHFWIVRSSPWHPPKLVRVPAM